MTGLSPIQIRAGKVLLTALESDGFMLAGGGALIAHEITSRPTDDVDAFVVATTAQRFADAVSRAVAAFRSEGWTVLVDRQVQEFAHLTVSDAREAVAVDLGVDWFAYPSVNLDIGAVISLHDAVASKIGAAFSRGEIRDFLDVDSIRGNAGFTDVELIAMAKDRDPGFDTRMFAQALIAASLWSEVRAAKYGVSAVEWEGVAQRLARWGDSLKS